jgi:hypothetical protein
MQPGFHVDYNIIKTQKENFADEHLEQATRIKLTPFPPGTFPSFLCCVTFLNSIELAADSPTIHFVNRDQFYYSNLGYNLQFGTSTIPNRDGAVHKIWFNISLPVDSDRFGVRIILRDKTGQVRASEVGSVFKKKGIWTAEITSEFRMRTIERGNSLPYAVFIGGAPKSGTTWVELLLNRHPDVIVVGEGQFFGFVNACHYRSTNRWLPPALAFGQDLDIVHTALLQYIFAYYAKELGCSFVLDRTPGNAAKYRHLFAIAPESKAIHCVRHPLDVLISRLYHETKLLRDGSPTELDQHRDAITYVSDQLLGVRHTLLDLRQPGSWSLVTSLLDEWILAQSEALAALEEYPDRILVSSYEKMLEDPIGRTKEIFAFIGLHASETEVASCVEQSSFESITGRNRGVADAMSFFRSGTSRQFLTHFDPEDQHRAMSYIKKNLRSFEAFGYFE